MSIDPALLKTVTDVLRTHGVDVTKETIEQIRATMGYVPKVGVLGKTGVGKSALCNALFGHDVAEVSDVAACTRKPQQFLLETTGDVSGVVLIDLPGLGENEARDVEYSALYRSLLPELDLVLWVVKGDDRALKADKAYYDSIIAPELGRTAKPFLAVINQADKVEPSDDWNREERRPGDAQATSIAGKVTEVSVLFDVPSDQVRAVSATRRWALAELVERIVDALPDHAKYGFVNGTEQPHVSPRARQVAREGLINTIKKNLGKTAMVLGPVLAVALMAVLRARD